ncbi:uncharacterized protein LOC110826242 [Carica papaya]|uniref:uncharacterized protein LOC110826242 n=1 Tax=Carica papaya TaxID=3649 RepID=UPI000B8D0A0F|nr:uncharacterized protein LOC110826242 [Carica papaya]
MDLTHDWKAQFPVRKDGPLLLSGQMSRSILGPLFFKPKPEYQLLFFSPALLPPLLPPAPKLSLSRFLTTSSDSPVPLSTSSLIASLFGSQYPRDAAFSLSHNRLQFLPWPGNQAALVFFSTGSNHDQIGFLVLSVKNLSLDVKVADNGDVFVAKDRFNCRILRILVNPVDDFLGYFGNSFITIGYVMAWTMYSVHWYSVKSSESSERPLLGYMGCKLFKSCSVAGACWSPHLPQESLILLESGALFLFDLGKKSHTRLKGNKLKVSWDDSGNYKWLGCEFSWHPRIFIVARSDAVFLVDLRLDECYTTCLERLRQIKEIVLGFGILNKDLSVLLPELFEFGGFTLIRLMSSGKIEAQNFCASWNLVKELDIAHGDLSLGFRDCLSYSAVDEEYKFPKRFKYLRLNYLHAYLNRDLTEVMDSRIKKSFPVREENELFNEDFHKILCEKLRLCGFGRFRSSLASVFNDVSLPTSLFEIALRQTWASFPLELLLLAFSSHSEFLEVLLDKKRTSLEFSIVPDLPQLPPFILRKPECRSSKWTHKVQRSNELVGPVLPLPVLLTLHEFRNGCLHSQKEDDFSAELEFSHQFNEVLQVAREVAVLEYDSELHDDQTVSLAADSEEMWIDSQNPKSFISYHPALCEVSTVINSQGNHFDEDKKFATLVTKVHKKESLPSDIMQNIGLEQFDDLCPTELKFNTQVMNFESQEQKVYNTFKKHFSLWQERFSPYQQFCSRYKLQG